MLVILDINRNEVAKGSGNDAVLLSFCRQKMTFIALCDNDTFRAMTTKKL